MIKYRPELYLAFAIVILVISCSERNQTAPNQVTDFYIKTDTLFISDDNSDVFVGQIRHIALNPDTTLYVLDTSDNTVKRFDQNGEMLSILLSGRGRGPGETENPNTIFVDTHGNLYVTDLSQNKLLVLNPSNELLAETSLSFRPSQIVAPNPDTVYVIGFRFSYSGDLVKQFIRVNQFEYEPMQTFGSRDETGDPRVVAMAGWSDRLSLDSGGKIYLARFFPYQIDIYSPELELISSLTQAVNFITAPSMDRNTGMITTTGVIREPLPLSQDKLLIRYLEIDENQNWVNYFDLYDQDGVLLVTKSFKELEMSEKPIHMISDANANVLYSVFNDPYPTILKHQITFQ
jgi:hypothetical protein